MAGNQPVIRPRIDLRGSNPRRPKGFFDWAQSNLPREDFTRFEPHSNCKGIIVGILWDLLWESPPAGIEPAWTFGDPRGSNPRDFLTGPSQIYQGRILRGSSPIVIVKEFLWESLGIYYGNLPPRGSNPPGSLEIPGVRTQGIF